MERNSNMVNTKKRLYKQEYAIELFSIAQGDFRTVKALLSVSDPGRPENILFLTQQTVEKAVKAVLIFQQISFPMVHDLGILIALLPDRLMPPNGFNLTELNPYASIRRYEEGKIPLIKDEVEGAVQAATEVLEWAHNIISKKP
jgi:HEPN domain-containing protein